MGDLRKLPQWAQRHIAQFEQEIEAQRRAMERLREAHSILFTREWFVLNGPNPTWTDRERYRLWILNRDDALPVCSLGPGDVLLVGRERKKTP